MDRSSFELLPDLHYFGVTQKRASLDIREKIPTDRDSQLALLSALTSLAAGRVVLATCERFEVYASATELNPNAWAAFLADWFQLPLTELTRYLDFFSGRPVAQHLLRVAAGLESRIVGERQILGQVRNAHRNALEQGTLDAQLSLLVRTAIRVGKRVRWETPLGRGGRSIATLAMDWLRREQESLTGRTVAIIGSGRLAGLVAAQVIVQKPGKLILSGRNQTRAALLAEQTRAACHEFCHLRATLDESDLVFTCTASPGFLVDASLMKNRARPVRLVDLCVPRNVDPAVAEMPQVAMAHLDDIVSCETGHGLVESGVVATSAIEQAEALVAEELDSFLQWRRERQAVPLISDLLSRATTCVTGRRTLHEQIMRLKAGAAV